LISSHETKEPNDQIKKKNRVNPSIQACRRRHRMLHGDSIQVFSFPKPNTFALPSTPEIFFYTI